MRKVAIITGGSSGIGGATAVGLGERGVDSIVTFNSHEDRVRDVVEAVRQRGAKAVPLRLDVGESARVIAFREELIAALNSEWKASSFDYLVNNAGFLQIAGSASTPLRRAPPALASATTPTTSIRKSFSRSSK